MPTNPRSLIPLRPVVFDILLLLNEAPVHGYGLMKALAERASGRTILGPGTMYRTLKEMQQLGLVALARQRPAKGDDPRRRYYRITRFGERVAAAEAKRMNALVGIARDGNLLPDTERA